MMQAICEAEQDGLQASLKKAFLDEKRAHYWMHRYAEGADQSKDLAKEPPLHRILYNIVRHRGESHRIFCNKSWKYLLYCTIVRNKNGETFFCVRHVAKYR